jgi:hypothetical protein
MNETGKESVKGGAPRLCLGTLEGARKSLGRWVRARAAGRVDDKTFRAVMYGCSILLSYFKAENDKLLELRLDALERKLERMQ